uniref:aminoacetone oxidase family FAD-binding enzyme n=1 Tax=Candidatus Ventrenecus sp. TaxID=3085654 RepID=UPI003FEE3F10
MKNVLIIGGGVSGVTTAIVLASEKVKVTLMEGKDKLLKKLLITGNGRCNFYNEDQSFRHYHSTHQELLQQFLKDENPIHALNFIENLGIVPLVKNGYYYPFTNKASTVYEAFLERLSKTNVKVLLNHKVKDIELRNNGFFINNEFYTDVVLATGSKAYPLTGSDGSGYSLLPFLKDMMIPVLPALTYLECQTSYNKLWKGIRSQVTVKLYIDNEMAKKETGELQFTEKGLSGICVFNLSGSAALAISQNKNVQVHLDFTPFTDDILSFLQKWSEEKNIKETLAGFLQEPLIKMIMKQSKIKEEDTFADLSSERINKLLSNLTDYPLSITGTGDFSSSQVCQGGISLKSVNIKKLCSLDYPHLYFTGEILDVFGDCGGYNLTFAILSGLVVGRSIKNDSSKTS